MPSFHMVFTTGYMENLKVNSSYYCIKNSVSSVRSVVDFFYHGGLRDRGVSEGKIHSCMLNQNLFVLCPLCGEFIIHREFT